MLIMDPCVVVLEGEGYYLCADRTLEYVFRILDTWSSACLLVYVIYIP